MSSPQRNLREVDVFVRYAVPFEELWTGSEKVHINDSVVRVMSLEHLLRVKRISAASA